MWGQAGIIVVEARPEISYRSVIYIKRTKTHSTADGTPRYSCRLMESYRQGDKVVKRTLLNLGTDWEVPKDKWRAVARRVSLLLEGPMPFLFDTDPDLAAEYMARGAAGRAGDRQTRQRDALIAEAVVMARALHPSSEREAHRWLRDHSAAWELLGLAGMQRPKLSKLYRIGDQLWRHRRDILPGNVSEPDTLRKALGRLDRVSEGGKPMVVMDAGISTEDNLAWLASQGYKYLCVDRRRAPAPPDEPPDLGPRHRTLCIPPITDLHVGLSQPRRMKKYERVLEKVGRLKEKYRSVAGHHKVTVSKAQGPNAVAVQAKRHKAFHQADNAAGCYQIRSNDVSGNAESLLRTYWRLTEVELTFRSLKFELGMRPIYHKLDHRIKAQLMITLIAYHGVHLIRRRLKDHGISAGRFPQMTEPGGQPPLAN